MSCSNPECAIPLDEQEFYPRRGQCKRCVIAKNDANRRRSPDAARARQRRYRAANKVALNRKERARRAALRAEVIEAYGGACACCGEAQVEFLSLDHVEGRDVTTRHETSEKAYALAKREGFPGRFQILCFNCNCAKGFFGICPHETARMRMSTNV